MSSMAEGLKHAWALLSLGLTAQQQRTAMLIILLAGFGFHVLWACGYIPGLPGFALANDVTELRRELEEDNDAISESLEDIKDQLHEDRIDRLEDRIRHFHMLRCQAESPEMRRLYADRVNDNLLRHRRLSRTYLRLSACEDL
jgi:hypothetical protein